MRSRRPQASAAGMAVFRYITGRVVHRLETGTKKVSSRSGPCRNSTSPPLPRDLSFLIATATSAPFSHVSSSGLFLLLPLFAHQPISLGLTGRHLRLTPISLLFSYFSGLFFEFSHLSRTSSVSFSESPSNPSDVDIFRWSMFKASQSNIKKPGFPVGNVEK